MCVCIRSTGAATWCGNQVQAGARVNRREQAGFGGNLWAGSRAPRGGVGHGLLGWAVCRACATGAATLDAWVCGRLMRGVTSQAKTVVEPGQDRWRKKSRKTMRQPPTRQTTRQVGTTPRDPDPRTLCGNHDPDPMVTMHNHQHEHAGIAISGLANVRPLCHQAQSRPYRSCTHAPVITTHATHTMATLSWQL